MNAPQSLQPPTTLSHTPLSRTFFLNENRRQSFSGKEVKDNCFKGAHVTEVADECGGKNLPLTDSTFKDLDTRRIYPPPPNTTRAPHVVGSSGISE
ncbi:hypothetical protein Tco_0821969 [Tanacetum coccineum]|uniref:Uncharacterized protein n=1 Tax=Tanacetum coccineum TaxID=301880 RepID=A0ABQ5ADQ5_9ASTR